MTALNMFKLTIKISERCNRRSLLNRVLGLLACSCAWRVCVVTCLRDWHASVLDMLACLRASVLGVLTCLACLLACVLGVLAGVRACLLWWNVLFSYVFVYLVCFFVLSALYFSIQILKILTAKNLCAWLSWTYFLFTFWYQLIKLCVKPI